MRPRVPKTKTFNACWTCRRRKLKCPGPRPICDRCTKAGLSCEGFDVKLCWSPSQSIDPSRSANDGPFRWRIHIPRGKNVLRSYNANAADSMLEYLETQSLLPCCDAQAGPFTVFKLEVTGLASFDNPQLSQNDERLPSRPPLSEITPEVVTPTPPFTVSPRSLSFDASLLDDALNDWNRILITHYLYGVADLLQPINHPQNPYRGKVATALKMSDNPLYRKALFHSILSTSAFHLRGPGHLRHEDWATLDWIGRIHRLETLKLLQTSLNRPYVDLQSHYLRVSTILALITTDFMEGSMTEFLTHLKACEQMRQDFQSSGGEIIQENPYMRQLDIISSFLATLARTTMHQQPGILPLLESTDSLSFFDNPFMEDSTCLQFIYGVSSTTASSMYLVNKFWQYGQLAATMPPSFSTQLSSAILLLDNIMSSWEPNEESFTFVAANNDKMILLLQNLAVGFHHAAQIYFQSCFIVPCGNRRRPSIAQLSEYTLEALEEAEVQKMELNQVGASIAWPAFVAACEAPIELRPRWRRYWETLLKYRIGCLSAIWSVVQKVWRREFRGIDLLLEEQLSESQGVMLGSIQLRTPKWSAVLNGSTVIMAI